MLRCRPVFCAASRGARATWFLAAFGLVVLAAPGFAASGLDASPPALLAADDAPPPQPDTPAPKKPDVSYAEIWIPRDHTGAIHLHGGVFAPINADATSATLGARLGFDLGSHVLFGVMADWAYKSKNLLEPVDSGLPGFEPQILRAKVDAHLVPAMVFLQVKLTDKFPLVPYAGVGAGYEWLALQAKDYRSDESRTATYANWAWQSYAGVGIRLSQGLRLDSEVFYNGGLLGRDVSDQNGDSWREVVDVNGVGARVGLEIVY